MRIFITLACAFMLTSSAVAAPPKENPVDKVICKRVYEADTGSHFTSSKRVCMKASDWEQLDREKDEAMRSYKDSARVDPNTVSASSAAGGPR